MDEPRQHCVSCRSKAICKRERNSFVCGILVRLTMLFKHSRVPNHNLEGYFHQEENVEQQVLIQLKSLLICWGFVIFPAADGTH